MAPAGEPDRGAVLREAKRAAGMGAITMHDGLIFATSGGVSRRAITEKAPGGKREVRIGGPWLGASSRRLITGVRRFSPIDRAQQASAEPAAPN
jgi:hypothetical protein